MLVFLIICTKVRSSKFLESLILESHPDGASRSNLMIVFHEISEEVLLVEVVFRHFVSNSDHDHGVIHSIMSLFLSIAEQCLIAALKGVILEISWV